MRKITYVGKLENIENAKSSITNMIDPTANFVSRVIKFESEYIHKLLK